MSPRRYKPDTTTIEAMTRRKARKPPKVEIKQSVEFYIGRIVQTLVSIEKNGVIFPIGTKCIVVSIHDEGKRIGLRAKCSCCGVNTFIGGVDIYNLEVVA